MRPKSSVTNFFGVRAESRVFGVGGTNFWAGWVVGRWGGEESEELGSFLSEERIIFRQLMELQYSGASLKIFFVAHFRKVCDRAWNEARERRNNFSKLRALEEKQSGGAILGAVRVWARLEAKFCPAREWGPECKRHPLPQKLN